MTTKTVIFQDYIQNTPSIIDTKFYTNLLRLEEKIFNRKYSLKTIDEICQLYAKCVEHYDCLQDPIKYYFTEKIQTTIAYQSTLKLLIKQEKKGSMKISSSSDENVEGEEENFEQYFESNSPDLKMARQEFEEKQQIVQQTPTSDSKQFKFTKHKKNYSISKKKIERQKKTEMFMCLEEDKQQYNPDTIVADQKSILSQNEVLKQQQLDNQAEKIKQRIMDRRKIKQEQLNSHRSENNVIDVKSCEQSLNNVSLFEMTNQKNIDKLNKQVEDVSNKPFKDININQSQLQSFLHYADIIDRESDQDQNSQNSKDQIESMYSGQDLISDQHQTYEQSI